MWYPTRNKTRVALAAFGFFGTVLLPPWAPLLAMLLLSLRFDAWEAIAIGFFADLAWFAPAEGGGLLASLPLFTLAGLALAWGLEPLRREFIR